jgi:hypothetical protein
MMYYKYQGTYLYPLQCCLCSLKASAAVVSKLKVSRHFFLLQFCVPLPIDYTLRHAFMITNVVDVTFYKW